MLTGPADRRKRLVPLTVDQVRQLAAALPARNRAMVITQAGLGLRIGELLRAGSRTSQLFKRAVRATEGIPDSTTPHDLRHHFASVLLAAGRSLIEVAERLGHENATLVLTTYGHLVQGEDDLTRQAVDAAWSVPAPAGTEQERNEALP